MNFYIGDSKNDINPEDYNVAIDDELQDCIDYLSRKNLFDDSFDIGKFNAIDPYDDIEICVEDLPELIKMCEYILINSLLDGYKYDKDEAKENLNELIKMCKKALKNGTGLVSMGD